MFIFRKIENINPSLSDLFLPCMKSRQNTITDILLFSKNDLQDL